MYSREPQPDYLSSQSRHGYVRTHLKYGIGIACVGLAVATSLKTGALTYNSKEITVRRDASSEHTSEVGTYVIDPNTEPPILMDQPKTILYDGPFDNPKDLRKIGIGVGTLGVVCAYFEPGSRPDGISIQTDDELSAQTPTWLLVNSLGEDSQPNQGYIKVTLGMVLHGQLLQCAADID